MMLGFDEDERYQLKPYLNFRDCTPSQRGHILRTLDAGRILSLCGANVSEHTNRIALLNGALDNLYMCATVSSELSTSFSKANQEFKLLMSEMPVEQTDKLRYVNIKKIANEYSTIFASLFAPLVFCDNCEATEWSAGMMTPDPDQLVLGDSNASKGLVKILSHDIDLAMPAYENLIPNCPQCTPDQWTLGAWSKLLIHLPDSCECQGCRSAA